MDIIFDFFTQFTEWSVNWISGQPVYLIYIYFSIIAYLENVVPPIPGDVLVAFAGYLVAIGQIDLTIVIISTVIASVIGFYNVYVLGDIWGKSVFDRGEEHWLLKFFDLEYLEKVKKWMAKYGQGVIVANRFLAGSRSVIALMAGMSHLNLKKTLISAVISSLFWNSILIAFGYFVQNNWEKIGDYLANYSKLILVLIILIITVRYYYSKKIRKVAENK